MFLLKGKVAKDVLKESIKVEKMASLGLWSENDTAADEDEVVYFL